MPTDKADVVLGAAPTGAESRVGIPQTASEVGKSLPDVRRKARARTRKIVVVVICVALMHRA